MLYSSATGASEPNNLAYMTRLGTFGYKSMVRSLCDLKRPGLVPAMCCACLGSRMGSNLGHACKW